MTEKRGPKPNERRSVSLAFSCISNSGCTRRFGVYDFETVKEYLKHFNILREMNKC